MCFAKLFEDVQGVSRKLSKQYRNFIAKKYLPKNCWPDVWDHIKVSNVHKNCIVLVVLRSLPLSRLIIISVPIRLFHGNA